MTGVERKVWIRLRGRRLEGWRFRRQHPIGPYVVDFFCPAARLIVEVNGRAHDDPTTWAYDERRQSWLESEGYRVVRIPVHLVDADVTAVTDTILAALEEEEAAGRIRTPLRLASPATSP